MSEEREHCDENLGTTDKKIFSQNQAQKDSERTSFGKGGEKIIWQKIWKNTNTVSVNKISGIDIKDNAGYDMSRVHRANLTILKEIEPYLP